MSRIEEIIREEAGAVPCTFPAGHTVFRQGEVALGIYFLRRGRVAVVRNGTRIAEIGPDRFIAEADLSDDQPRTASVVTIEPTECLLFTRDTFIRLTEKHPELSLGLAREAVASAARPVNANSGVKSTVQNKLVETFETLYALKAFTRFSVAVLGCPVKVSGAAIVEVIEVGEVKAVVLSSPTLTIEAYDSGAFHLRLLSPDRKTLCFDPVPVQRGHRFTLSSPGLRLERVA